jgi:hypothetical protein
MATGARHNVKAIANKIRSMVDRRSKDGSGMSILPQRQGAGNVLR